MAFHLLRLRLLTPPSRDEHAKLEKARETVLSACSMIAINNDVEASGGLQDLFTTETEARLIHAAAADDTETYLHPVRLTKLD